MPTVSFSTNSSRSSGSSLPDWKQRIVEHREATTSLSGSREFWLSEGYDRTSYFWKSGSGPTLNEQSEVQVGYVPFTATFGIVDPGLDQEAYNSGVAKLYKLLADRQTGLSVPLVIGEARETLRMIRNPANALVNLIKKTQLPKYKRASRRIRKIRNRTSRLAAGSRASSDLWLETQFGWAPLLSDIDSGIEVWNQKLDTLLYEEFNIFSKAERLGPLSAALTRETGRARWTEHTRSIFSTSYRMYGETYNKFGGTRGQLGLRWGEFVPTVWELLPWSFLIDYFSNIGDVLGACFVDLGIIRRVSRVRKRSVITDVLASNLRVNPSLPVDSFSGYIARKRLVTETFVRTPGLTIYPPSLRLEIPGSSSKKWLNMGALLRGQFRSARFF